MSDLNLIAFGLDWGIMILVGVSAGTTVFRAIIIAGLILDLIHRKDQQD